MITIKKNFEFRRVLSRGKSVNGNNLAIYFFPNRLNQLRFGFAIGKKAGKAVSRNRIKRVNKHCLLQSTLNIVCVCAHTQIYTRAPQLPRWSSG